MTAPDGPTSSEAPATTTSQATGAGPLAARTGRAAVDLAEKILCGDGAVRSASVAEGRCLGGARAASLLLDGAGSALPVGARGARVGWVHHGIEEEFPLTSHRFALRLEARTAQQAVDHCAVAHVVARRLAVPVACRLPRAIADGIHLVHLPAPGLLDDLVGEEGPHGGADVSAASVRAVLDEALAAVASRTGRPLDLEAVESRGENAVVGVGAAPAPTAEAAPEGAGVVLAAAPECDWSERLLLATAATLGRVADVALARAYRPRRGAAAVAVGRRGFAVQADAAADALFVADAGLLERDELASELREGGLLLLASRGGDAGAAGLTLPAAVRRRVAAGELRAAVIDPWAALGDAEPEPKALRRVIEGALLASVDGLAALSAAGSGVVAAALDAAPEAARAALTAGTRAVRPVDGEALRGPTAPRGAPGARLRQPAPATTSASEALAWKRKLRHFHLTGDGAWSAAENLPSLPLWPVGLREVLSAEPAWRQLPLLVHAEDGDRAGEAEPVHAVIERGLDALREAGEEASVLRRHVERLARRVDRAVTSHAPPCPAADGFDRAFSDFADELDLSEAAAKQVERELERLRGVLPREGTLLGLAGGTVPALHARAVHRVVAPRRAELVAELRRLVNALTGILGADDSHGASSSSAEAVGASLGRAAGSLVDPEAFARTLPKARGSRPLTADRRARIARTLAVLRRAVGQEAPAAELVVVSAEPLPPAVASLGVRSVHHADPAAAAVGLFDALVADVEEILRARRVARLEVAGAYDEGVHDAVLERFGWEAFTEDELLLAPRVVVLERATRLRASSLGSFSELLRSARPVHVLVSEDSSGLLAAETWEALAGYHRGLGHLAVAHREAFVVQATLTRPAHLTEELERMASALRPAVALVAVPSRRAPAPRWAQAVSALYGRATPCFRHDPTAGRAWVDRFDVSANPAPDRPWPSVAVDHVAADGAEASLDVAFTFAHAAALSPAHRAHFRVVPPEAWNDEQVELAAFLDEPRTDARARVPFIWVVDAEGRLARAVVTRELAFACRDRLESWHVLQELAGSDSGHARRAATAAREQVLAETGAERSSLESAHVRELDEVRRSAGRECMERLARALLEMDLDGLVKPAAAGAASQPAAPSVASTAAVPSAEQVVAAVPAAAGPAAAGPAEGGPVEAEEDDDDEDVSFGGPYIDTPLCTSCNECVALNPLLFAYDENKQARITDAAAGTFQELVAAAEKCPARCIHPGEPREGDATATPELVARAAKFQP